MFAHRLLRHFPPRKLSVHFIFGIVMSVVSYSLAFIKHSNSTQLNSTLSELVNPFDQSMIPYRDINAMPNEILRMFLINLDVQLLIALRVMNKKWRSMIEYICSFKKSLIIGGKDDPMNISELCQEYNGLIDFNDCVILRIESDASTGTISLSDDFCDLLVKLFPQVETLVFHSALDCSFETADNICFLLNRWSTTIVNLHLSTIYGYNDFDKTRQLCGYINELPGLKRLYFPDVSLLDSTTLARLEHCFFLESSKITETVPKLGPNCTSLHASRHVSLENITQWLGSNAPLVRGLTNLSILLDQHEVFPFVCANFGGLEKLHIGLMNGKIFKTEMISPLARLSNLTELAIDFIRIDLNTLTRFATMKSVKILLFAVHGFQENVAQFSGEEFCKILASIFPNIVQLTFKHRQVEVCEGVAQNLKHFDNLRKHVIAAPE